VHGVPLASASSIASSTSSRGVGGAAFGAPRGGGAAFELFVRLNRARQTLDFARRQAEAFAELDRAELGVWEALELLNELTDYEAGLLAAAGSGGGGGDETLSPDMCPSEHALQVGRR
jgi:hypothetical protein